MVIGSLTARLLVRESRTKAAGLRELAKVRQGVKGLYPHVGRFDPPEWLFTDEYPPEAYAQEARGWLAMGGTVIGGCCGTTPDHIAAVARVIRG